MRGMDLENKTKEIASTLFSFLADERPSFFDKGGWKGKVVEWSMQDESFRVQLLRFLDVLPALKSDALVMKVFGEYLAEAKSAPVFLRQAAEVFARTMTPWIAAPVVRASVKSLARQFIAGPDPEDALPALAILRKEGARLSVDLIGEAVVSDHEAASYANRYLALLDFLGPKFAQGSNKQGQRDQLDVSLKISSLYSQIEPLNWEGSIEKTVQALRPVILKAQERGASVTLDMEQYYFKDLFLAVFKQAVTEFRQAPVPGIALQAYLKDTREDLLQLINWARENKQRITVRLVKGAYWDYETVINRQNGWPVPVFLNKEETDRNFEDLTRILLENVEHVYPAIGTHNMRSISHALAKAAELKLSSGDFELQMLYGMADPLRRALSRMSIPNPVRIYCPVGELLPGMAYLVRRILENTSNESFFRRTFAEKVSFEELIKPPGRHVPAAEEEPASFRNVPAVDFSKKENRQRIKDSLSSVRASFGRRCPLLIGGREVFTEHETSSVNPARPDEIIGRISSAAQEHADKAVEEARQASASWSRTPADVRAGFLFRAAAEMRKRRFSLAALEVFEVGKPVLEADGDVAEAIDYLEYYGRQMKDLGKPRRLGAYPGELNEYVYEPKGVALVVSPWNFPLAIPAGMASAALVAGNCAILKPSGLSPVVAWELVDVFKAAGLPRGVLQYLPGPGAETGEYLVSHPGIDVIAFTGSKEVGCKIIKLAGETRPGQRNVKKVVAEMGGKNAIIVDDTADLDEAVRGVLLSSLGYQGQKCSACSRVIVLPGAYAEFRERLAEAMKSVVIGPPEEPRTFMGPLVDQAALAKVRGYIEKGKQEGTPLYIRESQEEGFYAGPALFEAEAGASIAREEIFGPVLALIKAADFDEALAIANQSEYALTGGIYSRSPENIRKAKAGFRAGNLYINRKITGALVGRQPFGGFGMSGTGSKTGGPDYLLQFLNPKTISENTLRKGVAPREGE
jgi:RHH-type proline utilization regulon transcriptional repressor/proline dehydrogenase/delta 1-pyrroline-5-carboxylate dehydrogenase